MNEIEQLDILIEKVGYEARKPLKELILQKQKYIRDLIKDHDDTCKKDTHKQCGVSKDNPELVKLANYERDYIELIKKDVHLHRLKRTIQFRRGDITQEFNKESYEIEDRLLESTNNSNLISKLII